MDASKSRDRPDYFGPLQIYHCARARFGLITTWRDAQKVMVSYVVHKFGARRQMGEFAMLRYRLALGVFATAIVLLPLTSAWAFSQQSAGGRDGNSSFADPDDQITNSFGVRPLDSNEQSIQLGVQQQGTFDPLWWEQSLHGYGPYYQTVRPGK
jgi:hypothetical protein